MLDNNVASRFVLALDTQIMTSFRCYAYSNGDRWHAICTDLDIAVDGESYQEVEAALDICIGMYLKSISELPEQDRRQLLTRRAPWHVRAWLAGSTWAHQLKRANDRRARSFLLESQAPAPS